ncbi:hypothetical protein V9L05_07845 [Bernardetia sp. Wsw4-3y2]|uniref:hypothetical protein n=1 Tax=unclassified Bernardetia TaxID=2647129 RepID=UPI0030D37387
MKSIKTLAFASLVAFSTLTLVACDGTKSSDATNDTTTVIIDETIIDETDDASNMMEAAGDSLEVAADSLGAAAEEVKEGM